MWRESQVAGIKNEGHSLVRILAGNISLSVHLVCRTSYRIFGGRDLQQEERQNTFHSQRKVSTHLTIRGELAQAPPPWKSKQNQHHQSNKDFRLDWQVGSGAIQTSVQSGRLGLELYRHPFRVTGLVQSYIDFCLEWQVESRAIQTFVKGARGQGGKKRSLFKKYF